MSASTLLDELRNFLAEIFFGISITFVLLACAGPNPNESHQVQYRVTGSAQEAGLTISTPSGTEQRTVRLPYTSPTYDFKGFEHAYVSAQNQGETGTVTVELIVDGSSFKKATSEGAYAIASTDWMVGSDR